VYEGASLAVVVPAYNEAGFIGDVVETMPEYVDTVFVVDDHSADGTWEEIRPDGADRGPDAASLTEDGQRVVTTDGSGEARTEHESFVTDDVVGVRHRTNRGRGGAVKTGYKLAMLTGHDVVAVMDGDGQMDPDVLDGIVEPVATGAADYAKGNRLVDREHCRQMSRWRLFGNVLLTALTKVASGLWWMRDPQNGYTAISSEALAELEVTELYEDYGFLNDLLVRLNARGLRVVDVPTEAKYGDESSGIEYRSFVPKLSFLLCHRFLWRLWMTYVVRSGYDRRTDHDVG